MVTSAAKDLERLRRYWDKQPRSYDKQMLRWDRKFFGDTRQWLCGKAHGSVLEVAIGTGLNMSCYPEDIDLSGIDLSPAMLEYARRRCDELGRTADLREGDAQRLDFPDDSFDTVVSTFSLCGVPDDRGAVAEMWRVLRPGGRLLLADHVVSTSRLARLAQRLLEFATLPIGGENFRRRPIKHVRAQGFTIEEHDRFRLGIVERLVATKPQS